MTSCQHYAVAPIRSEWLMKASQEEIFEPERPIIDPHHHLWTRQGTDYLLPEFIADIESGHNIIGTVYIDGYSQYRKWGPKHLRPVGEVEYAAQIAESSANDCDKAGICSGIIGSIDLRCTKNVTEAIETMQAAGRGRFRGVRQIAAWHPDPNIKPTITSPPPSLLLDQGLRQGMAILKTNDLIFETWALHTQLPELYDLACACPDIPIVMDHCGGAVGTGLYAGRLGQAFFEWREAIRTVARARNLYAKIGGFGMPVWGFDFHLRNSPPKSEEISATVRPYVETIVETFGPERCMFESNFPTDKGACTYWALWNAYKRLAKQYSDQEQHRLFAGTSIDVYRLEERADLGRGT